MANRPRLPNVDPEDLAKLASQYPGSGSGGSESGSGAGTTSGTTASGASAGTSAGAAGTTRSSSAGSGSAGSAPSSSRGTSSSAPLSAPRSSGTAKPAPTEPAPRKRGSWSAAFLTFIFALIALIAAAATIGAPSYRGEIRKLLITYVPQLDGEVVDMITGYDPDRLEMTYEGMDQRIAALDEALGRVAAVEGVSGQDTRALLFADRTAVKLDEVAGRLDAIAGSVDTLSNRSTAQGERLATLSGEMTAKTGQIEADLTTKIDGLSARFDDVTTRVEQSIIGLKDEITATREEIGGVDARLTSAEERIEDQIAVDSAIAERLAQLDERLAGLVGDFKTLLDLNDQVAATVATFKSENMPILAVIQLREAVNRSGPYRRELAFAGKVLNGAPGIRAALDTLDQSAADGIASVPELRRDLRLIANDLGTFVGKIESWADRVTGWYNMLVGTSPVPEARQGGSLVAAVATIDDALERGDLDMVMREGSVVLAEHRSPALVDWLAAVNQRSRVTQAVGSLEDVVYKRATAASQN